MLRGGVLIVERDGGRNALRSLAVNVARSLRSGRQPTR